MLFSWLAFYFEVLSHVKSLPETPCFLQQRALGGSAQVQLQPTPMRFARRKGSFFSPCPCGSRYTWTNVCDTMGKSELCCFVLL